MTIAAIVVGLAGCAGEEAVEPDDTIAEEPADDVDEDRGEPTEDDVVEPTQADPTAEDTETDAAEDGAAGPAVLVRDVTFQDQSVTVQAGTPVTWNNEDTFDHTVTSGTPGEPTGVFDQDLPAGGQVSITVDEPGTYVYWCEIHPNMTAELVVEPADG